MRAICAGYKNRHCEAIIHSEWPGIFLFYVMKVAVLQMVYFWFNKIYAGINYHLTHSVFTVLYEINFYGCVT